MNEVVEIESTNELCEGCGLTPLDGCSYGRMEPEPGQAPRRCPNYARRENCKTLATRWPVPRRYVDANLTDWANDGDNAQATVREMRSFLVWMVEDPEAIHPSIVIAGPNGTGKTRLAAAIINRADELCLSVVFANASGLIQRIRQTFDDGAEATQAEIFDDICGADLFALDDVGKERRTDFANEVLWAAISSRYDSGKPTIVTTNLSEQELADSPTWSGIMDRLSEDGLVVEMPGTSRRKTKPTFTLTRLVRGDEQ